MTAVGQDLNHISNQDHYGGPSEHQKCSLQDLPPEILLTLPLDRSSLTSMTRVSKCFLSIYTERLYRSVVFDDLRYPDKIELPRHGKAAVGKSVTYEERIYQFRAIVVRYPELATEVSSLIFQPSLTNTVW